MAANRWFMETRSLSSVMILCKSIRIETCRAGLMLAKFAGGCGSLSAVFHFVTNQTSPIIFVQLCCTQTSRWFHDEPGPSG